MGDPGDSEQCHPTARCGGHIGAWWRFHLCSKTHILQRDYAHSRPSLLEGARPGRAGCGQGCGREVFGPCANVSGLQNLYGEGGNAASGLSPLCSRQRNKVKQKKITLTKVPRRTSRHQAQSCQSFQLMVLAAPNTLLGPGPQSVRFCSSCGPGYTCQHISRGWGWGVAPAPSESDPWGLLWDRVKWGPRHANRDPQ